jgi:hypothetical protein
VEDSAVKIQSVDNKIHVQAPHYFWELDLVSDMLLLYDSNKRLISRAKHRPFISTTRSGHEDVTVSYELEGNRLSIIYSDKSSASRLTVTWFFHPDHIHLQPLIYESAEVQDVVQVVYFPDQVGPSYTPSMYSRYIVVPGLCMSPSISPIVDLHSRLSVTAVLGCGAMRGPGLTQQWGLPSHYFCTFNTADRWNAIGAKSKQSGAACWGLAELPQGDFRLEIREIAFSPVLNLRGDLWKHVRTPGTLRLGFSFLITFGENYFEAIRNYYTILRREGIVVPKPPSARKKKVLLSPQYNTWGVESSLAMRPEELNEETVLDILAKLRRSGMQARTLVIDDKWEGIYGELKHDETRFPNFIQMLDAIRSAGYFIGLWAAFLRCQDPSVLGLDESHLLHTRDGETLWLSHQTSRYGIFDVTQPAVQQVLGERAREFVKRYKPDLVKFDFGYELPSLDVAAPANPKWAGERLLQKGLEVVVSAMKAENPDLVIMYYGLSPLLLEYYDLHSPDDLVYCSGDYDLETNRRIFFSSLCGELGMPTYGSSGYDWESALDIWFDSAPSGTLGSLHCFDGDENGDLPKTEWISKYNGLSAILRREPAFHIHPVDVQWQGGLRAGFSPSWERIEGDKTVLLALRTYRFDGKPASQNYKAILHTDVMVVVSSMTDEGISNSSRLGIVPFGDGKCILHRATNGSAKLIEHYFDGKTCEFEASCIDHQLELSLIQTRDSEIFEWLEIVFEQQKG